MMRFRHSGGHVVNEWRMVIPLAEAFARARTWGLKAVILDEYGDHRLARVYAGAALALYEAAEDCAQWRRAAGWRDPNAADHRMAKPQ